MWPNAATGGTDECRPIGIPVNGAHDAAYISQVDALAGNPPRKTPTGNQARVVSECHSHRPGR